MAEGIDVMRLAQMIRTKREQDELTLRDVNAVTGIPVPTISRLERGLSKDIESSTLLPIARWLNASPEDLQEGAPEYPLKRGKPVESTPDVVDIFLRADKNLNRKTADALSTMFRAAYATLAAQRKGRE